jgi:hypothetical protein
MTRIILAIPFGIFILCGFAAAQLPGTVQADWDNQYQQLQDQLQFRNVLGKNAAGSQIPEDQVFNRNALILDSDQTPLDVQLRRTEALLDLLKSMSNPPDVSALKRQVQDIKSGTAGPGLAKTSSGADQEKAAFMALKKITRQAALIDNPLLDDVNDLLFVERGIVGPGTEYDGDHMCDQSHGHNSHRRRAVRIKKLQVRQPSAG